MKLKYYLRGAGVGMIVATLILTISLAFDPYQMSDDQIIAKAKALGMMDAAEVEELVNNEVANQQIIDESKYSSGDTAETGLVLEEGETETTKPEDEQPEAKQPEAEKPETEKPEIKQPETETTKPEVTKPESNSNSEQVVTKKESVAFSITQGQMSDVVVKNLYEAGIIDNQRAFNEYLDSNGYDAKIQTGTFYIQKGLTYEQLAKLLITNQQNRKTSPNAN